MKHGCGERTWRRADEEESRKRRSEVIKRSDTNGVDVDLLDALDRDARRRRKRSKNNMRGERTEKKTAATRWFYFFFFFFFLVKFEFESHTSR